MKKHAFLLMAALACTTSAPLAAQERTAGGSLQTQASWSALKALVERTQGNLDVLKVEFNAMKNCNNQGKLYSSTQNKCLDIVDVQVRDCAKISKLYSSATGTCIEPAGANRWAYSRVGPTATADAYSPGYAMTQVEYALSTMGIGQCAATVQGSKCSRQGAQCAVISSSSSGGGGRSYGPNNTVSSIILVCN